MSRVLVPSDGSANAQYGVRYVVNEFMKNPQLKIHVLNVQPPFSKDVSRFTSKQARMEFHHVQAEKALAPVRQALESAGIAYTVHTEVGDAADCIADAARRLRCDRIVMSTARKSSLVRLVENSVTNQVFERTTVPVQAIAGSSASTLERVGIPAGVGAGLIVNMQHRILFASDGSRSAEGAMATALEFPWPTSAKVRAVVASTSVNWLPTASEHTRSAIEDSFEATAATARSTLAQRWPDAEAVVIDAPPAEAILAEALRFDASLIVLGWRGHGAFRRLLVGSVSRNISENALCPVLVVRNPVNSVRCFVVGFDDCPNAGRALDFLVSLAPTSDYRVILVNVVEPVMVPASLGRLPKTLRTQIRREVAAINLERQRDAHARVADGAAQLARAGWQVETEVLVGAPLAGLLKAFAQHRGDVLVLGARATSGVERLLLGSVANGALNNAPVVLLVP